jgi:alkylation response protein AidB-like acyl-CoA dehydrogenase
MQVDEFGLSEEQQLLRETTARLARDVYAPKALEWDRNRTFLPAAERQRLAEMGFLGMCLPAEYGGGGAPLLDGLIVIEELSKESQVAAFPVFEANTGPARVIELFGSQEQKQRFLPPIVQGEVTLAVSISEPEAGSAATDLTVTARRDADEFVITGTKRWCSGAGHAEQYLVYARIDGEPGSRGIGALVVPADAAGLTFGPQERLMGFHGIPSADMYFDEVRVPADDLIVQGFKQLFTAFSIERLGNTTMSLAIGQACLDRTAAYVQQRMQFGRPIVEFQSVQMALADMILQVEAARLLLYRAAGGAGHGAPTSLEASIAKCFANEMAKKVSDAAMGLHGGYGYSEEYGLERYHRDAHGWALGGGTPSIQRIRIVSEYLGRSFTQRDSARQ